MVTIKSFALGAALAVGGGVAGYVMHKADVQACKAVYEQHPQEMRLACTESYNREIAQIEQTYKDIPTNPRVVGQRELSIEYVVSKEAGLRAPVLTFTPTGLQGVLAKEDLYGTTTLHFHPISAGKTEKADVKTAMLQTIKVE